MIQHIDYRLLQLITGMVERSDTLKVVAYGAAELLIFVYPLVLFLLWRQQRPDRAWREARKAVVLALTGVVMALAVKSLVNMAVTRPRPYLNHPELFHMPLQVDPPSFPSSHTMLAFVIACSLFSSGYRRLGGWLLVGAFVIGWGRVAAGVHYPSDVLAGLLIGVLVSAYLHRESSTLKRYLP